jgi:hypothetical protein
MYGNAHDLILTHEILSLRKDNESVDLGAGETKKHLP